MRCVVIVNKLLEPQVLDYLTHPSVSMALSERIQRVAQVNESTTAGLEGPVEECEWRVGANLKDMSHVDNLE